jgi:hypothetical protein
VVTRAAHRCHVVCFPGRGCSSAGLQPCSSIACSRSPRAAVWMHQDHGPCDPRRGTEPRGLVQLHDLMVCSAGAAASLGVHGSAAVAARNLEPCFVVERKHAPTSALVLGVADVRHPGITDRCGSARATPATFVRPTSRHWQLERAVVSQVSPVKAQRAWDNRAIVRKLLRQRQPEFAAALASAEHYFSCLCGRAGRRDRRDDRAQDLPS